MRRLSRAIGWALTLCVLAALIWIAGRVATERAIQELVAEAGRQGWNIELSDVAIGGFPDRLHATLTDLRVVEPRAGVLLNFPTLEIIHPIARLGRVTIKPDPASSVVDFPYQFQAAHSSAVVHVSPLPPFALRELTWEGQEVAARSIGLPSFAATQLSSSFEAGDRGHYHLEIALSDLEMPDGPEVSELRVQAVPIFDAPWSASGAQPSLLSLQIDAITIVWGSAGLAATGDLAPDAEGWLEGELDVEVTNWPGLLDQLRESGMLTETAHSQWMVALRAEVPEGVDITWPLVFDNRLISFGPFILGAAPQLF